MKHILAIVLAGLTVQTGFAGEATNAIEKSGLPDVSLEVFVESTGSSHEKIDRIYRFSCEVSALPNRR